mgnify:CR=1 FL=1
MKPVVEGKEGGNPGSLIRYFIGHNAPQREPISRFVSCSRAKSGRAPWYRCFCLSPFCRSSFRLVFPRHCPGKAFYHVRTCGGRDWSLFSLFLLLSSRWIPERLFKMFVQRSLFWLVSRKWSMDRLLSLKTRVTRQINSFAFEMKRMPISVEKCISTWDSIV